MGAKVEITLECGKVIKMTNPTAQEFVDKLNEIKDDEDDGENVVKSFWFYGHGSADSMHINDSNYSGKWIGGGPGKGDVIVLVQRELEFRGMLVNPFGIGFG